MNEYNEFVQKLNKYEQIAVNVAKLINGIYPGQYQLYSDISSIKFYDDSVSITSGEYFKGSYDEEYMSFDPKWLFLSYEEITKIVTKQKELELSKKEIADRLKKVDEQLEKEKAELTNKIKKLIEDNHDKAMEIIADGGSVKDLIKALVLKDIKDEK